MSKTVDYEDELTFAGDVPQGAEYPDFFEAEFYDRSVSVTPYPSDDSDDMYDPEDALLPDGANALDHSDAFDGADALDHADAFDGVDALDRADAFDGADVFDREDALDGSYIAEDTYVPDAMYAPSVPYTSGAGSFGAAGGRTAKGAAGRGAARITKFSNSCGGDLRALAEKRARILSVIIREAKQRLAGAPKGALHYKKTRKYGGFFAYDPESKTQKYLKASSPECIALAQKMYDTALLKTAESELKALENIVGAPMGSAQTGNMPMRNTQVRNSPAPMGNTIEKIYSELPDAVRELVTPVAVPDEVFARRWQEEEYVPKPFADGYDTEYRSVRGERMRSKSECIIAAVLNAAGIPYKYEKPLTVGGEVIYPDFTVLNVRTREVLYWEHLGKMDDAEYSARALDRLELYRKAGMVPGKGLILTFETASRPLTDAAIRSRIDAFLM